MNAEVATIRLYNNGEGRVSLNGNNGSIAKVVSINDLVSAFTLDTQDFNFPLFPKGLRKFVTRGDKTVVVIEQPAGVVEQVHYNGNVYDNIPVPGSIWISLLQEQSDGTYSIRKTNIFALDELGILTGGGRLKYWPFHNHTVQYGVCWGNDRAYGTLSRSTELSNLSSLYSIYFGSAFNNDLGHYFYPRTDDESRSVRNLGVYGFLSGKDFDYRWLRDSRSNLTSAINNIFAMRGENE